MPSSPTNQADEELYLLGLRLADYSTRTQFALCVSGVLSLYLVYAYIQESLFTNYEGFHYGFFLTLVQFLWYSLLSAIHRRMKGERGHVVPSKIYMALAASLVLSMGLANQALAHLNYPTQVLFKSCKLVSIMVIALIFRGKRYQLNDYVAVLFLVVGLVALSNANKRQTETAHLEYDIFGLIMITGSLLCDGISGNLQESVLKGGKYNAGTLEVIFYSHAWGSLFLIFLCMGLGQLVPAIEWLERNPTAILAMSAFSITGYFGVQCFMVLTKAFGILTAVVTTSVRKAFTVLLSFLLFPKPFTPQHGFAIFLVFVGVGIDSYHKATKKKDESKDGGGLGLPAAAAAGLSGAPPGSPLSPPSSGWIGSPLFFNPGSNINKNSRLGLLKRAFSHEELV